MNLAESLPGIGDAFILQKSPSLWAKDMYDTKSIQQAYDIKKALKLFLKIIPLPTFSISLSAV